MERLVFERSLELAGELGLIEGEAEQIVDSTPMLGAAAVQDTATLVRSGVRRLLDAVQASDAEAAAELGAGFASIARLPGANDCATGSRLQPGSSRLLLRRKRWKSGSGRECGRR
jgi:hypothetical protein